MHFMNIIGAAVVLGAAMAVPLDRASSDMHGPQHKHKGSKELWERDYTLWQGQAAAAAAQAEQQQAEAQQQKGGLTSIHTDASGTKSLAGRDSGDECGASSFIGTTSNTAPLVRDCQHLVADIGRSGSVSIENIEEYQHMVVQFETCAFGVQGRSQRAQVGHQHFNVGYGDIADLINDSINRFALDGFIGARGNMPCSGNAKNVEWGIYNPASN